jgi:murein DD-endopeptidase MepM/ murein hydrolase activator NlpD
MERGKVVRTKKVTTGRPFEAWPTDYRFITQKFGANPESYIKFGFPGHEGIDIRALLNTPFYAVLPGKVIRISNMRISDPTKESNYGWHIILDHGIGFTTLYAHCRPDFSVEVGQSVSAGDIIAHSGNTGFSTGPHLHLTVKKEGFRLPGWPAGYMDPWIFLQHFEGVTNGNYS